MVLMSHDVMVSLTVNCSLNYLYDGLGLLVQYTMERGVVHACHAGGVVHSLEGWTHHEVGAIDVDRIDLVWEAALKHGLKPISSRPPIKK